MRLKILLADDHKIVRDGLHSLLKKEAGMEVIGEADNGRETVQLAREMEPDIIIMDISMPDLNGVEATRQIISNSPEAKIIALSMHSDKRFVKGILSAGAKGYLLKDSAFEELVDAIHTVVSGKFYLSSGIAGVVVKDYIGSKSAKNLLNSDLLSAREREVLQLIAEGKSTKEVAATLHVSVKTIETHRQKIMQKLNIHSVAGLTRFAIREGLSSLDK
ncbi:MAG: response regulator [bacterium]